jgi:hypothetical protein
MKGGNLAWFGLLKARIAIRASWTQVSAFVFMRVAETLFCTDKIKKYNTKVG